MATESGRREAQERKLFQTLCPILLKDAATLLQEML